MVRAKFLVVSVEPNSADGETTSKTVRLRPVHNDSAENRAFWEATPAGHMEMTITNPLAFDQFLPGQSYYIDFTPAEG